MNTPKSIDIIIPSFRLQASFLLPLLDLPKPAGWRFRYYIVADNPAASVEDALLQRWQAGELEIFINPENQGASASRNTGIQAGNGSWILFLDDDVIAQNDLLFQYTRAIEQFGEETGFIGLTDFPPPVSAFTRALQVNDLTFFRIAAQRSHFPWGVTANMLYNREKMKGMQFSMAFPKNGGGEDVDLPLRICRENQQEFRCLPQARVTHPWWNDGKPHFDRFIRYGLGVGYLFKRHPERLAREFPNPPESLLLLVLLFPFFLLAGRLSSWLIILLAVPVFELLLVFLQSRKAGVTAPKEVFYVALLKNCFHLGVLAALWQQKAPQYLFSKVNIGAPKTQHLRLNRWKIIKLSLFLILFILLYYFPTLT